MELEAPGDTTRLASGGDVHRFSDAEAVAHAGAEAFEEEALASIAERGAFRVLLSGGSTPRRMLEILGERIDRVPFDWAGVHFFFGDERSVGPDSAASNYAMARAALLDAIPASRRHVERLHGERSDLAQAAQDYERVVTREFGCAPGDGPPSFDLVFLGMGDDGHTASLFPGTAGLEERTRWFVANEVPQLDTVRLTATFPLLGAANRILFLVCGEGKRERMAEIMRRDRAPASFHPCERVRTEGRLDWFVDRAAWAGSRPRSPASV